MPAPSLLPDPPARGRRRALRLHLWHLMLAPLAVALGLWGFATFGHVVWIAPLAFALVWLWGLAASLPFFLLVALLCQVAGDEPTPPRRGG